MIVHATASFSRVSFIFYTYNAFCVRNNSTNKSVVTVSHMYSYAEFAVESVGVYVTNCTTE